MKYPAYPSIYGKALMRARLARDVGDDDLTCSVRRLTLRLMHMCLIENGNPLLSREKNTGTELLISRVLVNYRVRIIFLFIGRV